jgi:hypothetical protein
VVVDDRALPPDHERHAGSPPRPRARRRGVARITERDRELLAFVAEHRLVLAAHVRSLLGISEGAAYARLRALSGAGFLTHTALFQGEPGCYQIAGKGLRVIGSDLPRPRIDLRCYRHDVGVAWLWLAARDGALGPIREVISERRLRSHDGTVDGRSRPLGVRLGGLGPGGRDRLHYPDLILVGTDGRRIAVELELSSKGRSRREKILAGYAADARVDAVLYLVDDPRVGRGVRSSASRLDISELVHVQRVRLVGAGPNPSAGAAAERAMRVDRSADARSGGSRDGARGGSRDGARGGSRDGARGGSGSAELAP